tara:strand:+ start:840 stop:1058 length:219 start_codon:yes stop_codon:yes gene_type:complete
VRYEDQVEADEEEAAAVVVGAEASAVGAAAAVGEVEASNPSPRLPERSDEASGSLGSYRFRGVRVRPLFRIV